MRHSEECVVALLDAGFLCSMSNARGWSAMYKAVEVCVVGWVAVSVGQLAALADGGIG